MEVSLPNPNEVTEVRSFLRTVDVDRQSMTRDKEMIDRYKMTVSLFQKEPGDTFLLEGISLIAFRHVFESIIV